MPEPGCNLQTTHVDTGPDQVEAVLYFKAEKPDGCWRVCTFAGVEIEASCLNAGDCRTLLPEQNPDLGRPIPEEINWGVPGAIND